MENNQQDPFEYQDQSYWFEYDQEPQDHHNITLKPYQPAPTTQEILLHQDQPQKQLSLTSDQKRLKRIKERQEKNKELDERLALITDQYKADVAAMIDQWAQNHKL